MEKEEKTVTETGSQPEVVVNEKKNSKLKKFGIGTLKVVAVATAAILGYKYKDKIWETTKKLPEALKNRSTKTVDCISNESKYDALDRQDSAVVDVVNVNAENNNFRRNNNNYNNNYNNNRKQQ